MIKQLPPEAKEHLLERFSAYDKERFLIAMSAKQRQRWPQ